MMWLGKCDQYSMVLFWLLPKDFVNSGPSNKSQTEESLISWYMMGLSWIESKVTSQVQHVHTIYSICFAVFHELHISKTRHVCGFSHATIVLQNRPNTFWLDVWDVWDLLKAYLTRYIIICGFKHRHKVFERSGLFHTLNGTGVLACIHPLNCPNVGQM